MRPLVFGSAHQHATAPIAIREWVHIRSMHSKHACMPRKLSTHAGAWGSRAVYRALSSYQGLVGVWRQGGRPVRGRLYEFHWQPGCIAGTSLTFDSMTLHPLRAEFARVGPGCPAAPEMLGTSHCVLRERAAPRWVPSTAAESAACVAIAGYGVRAPTRRFCT